MWPRSAFRNDVPEGRNSVATWIVIGILYGALLFAFGWLGGMRAAGRSIEDWGRRTVDRRTPRGTPASR
jgi:hypothetical protein